MRFEGVRRGFVQGEHNAVDGLPTSVRWIIVFAVGLSPILTFWIASVLGRFRRRKLWSRAQSGASVATDREASPRENEAVDQRADGALYSRREAGHRSLRQGAAAGRLADRLGARSPTQ